MLEMFKVHSLFCGHKKGVIDNRDKLIVNEFGVVDDYHYPTNTNILMLELDAYRQMNKSKNIALCMNKFYAHIIYEDMSNGERLVGDTLKKDDLRFKVKSLGKVCHYEDCCEYALSNASCPLREKTIYIECLKPGTIKIGDKLEVLKCTNTQ